MKMSERRGRDNLTVCPCSAYPSVVAVLPLCLYRHRHAMAFASANAMSRSTILRGGGGRVLTKPPPSQQKSSWSFVCGTIRRVFRTGRTLAQQQQQPQNNRIGYISGNGGSGQRVLSPGRHGNVSATTMTTPRPSAPYSPRQHTSKLTLSSPKAEQR